MKGLEDLKARLASVKETKSSLKKPVPTLKKFDNIKVDVAPQKAVPKEEVKR